MIFNFFLLALFWQQRAQRYKTYLKPPVTHETINLPVLHKNQIFIRQFDLPCREIMSWYSAKSYFSRPQPMSDSARAVASLSNPMAIKALAAIIFLATLYFWRMLDVHIRNSVFSAQKPIHRYLRQQIGLPTFIVQLILHLITIACWMAVVVVMTPAAEFWLSWIVPKGWRVGVLVW